MRKIAILISILAVLLLVSVAQATGGFNLDWWTVDGGGGVSTGGGYTLTYTLGQADAGTLSGGNYTLYGGFLTPADSSTIDPEYRILLPLVVR